MKTKRKSPTTIDDDPVAPLAPGMQHTHEETQKHKKRRSSNSFTPMEVGEPGDEELSQRRNPNLRPAERGPLNEEGAGDRQNDFIAELEELEPDIEKSS